jgi:hypothetical protein
MLHLSRRETAVLIAAGVTAFLGAVGALVNLVYGVIALLTLTTMAIALLLHARRHRTPTRLLRALDAIVTEVSAVEQRALAREKTAAVARRREEAEHLQHVEALLQLHAVLAAESLTPLAGRWAMDPVGLLRLVRHVQVHRPSLVVELGSGTSTFWLHRAMQRFSSGRVVAVDHDEEYARSTRQWLDGVVGGDVGRGDSGDPVGVEVRHAPLTEVDIDGARFRWYSPDAFDDLVGIDLLIVDGPPQGTGPQARFPALPMLLDRLSPSALIVVDDIDRHDEEEMVAKWLKVVPALAVAESPEGPGRHLLLHLRREQTLPTAGESGSLAIGDGFGEPH